MPNPNAFVDGIRAISPAGEELKATALKGPRRATVKFSGGRTGHLDLNIQRSALWATVLDSRRKSSQPVYVEIDPESGAIIEMLIPRKVRVAELIPLVDGDIRVKLIVSQARQYLRRANPDFELMRNILQSAKDAGTEVLVTESLDHYQIIDVTSQAPPRPPAPVPLVPDPPPSVVTEGQAVDLFNQMAGTSCDPFTAPSPCITFTYPYNGCWARAHAMTHLMRDAGIEPEKLWIYGNLYVSTSNSTYCYIEWDWHVAPTLLVDVPGGPEKRVVDPSLCTGPVTQDEWRDMQDHSAALVPTSADIYIRDPYPEATDPDYSQTDAELANFRDALITQTATFGPPPFVCPIAHACFFILDRNTYGEDEVNAMIASPDPPVIEAAFYVVVDGYSPYELSISSTTTVDNPPVYPAITSAPALSSQIQFEAAHLGMEYPAYLNRRQRVTWTYRVRFSGTDDFATEHEVVLTATISGITAHASIYLVRQPNPFELDGETCWLSTDLRVFRIRAGESKFGATMGASAAEAPAFIQDVIHNLNTPGASAGQTFEHDISTDQETSWLELSQTVDGTAVFNFAVAKVHYRRLAGDADNVRVFFRLFPASTTSVDYYQATTYRRGGSGGVVIPLLGTMGGDLVTIPCFATERVDTLTHSMNDQTDAPNIITIPANAGGAEVIRYFGCWLDFNQTAPQFPYTPGGDGPFAASDRLSVQQLITGQHQCVVSEIAFDLTPIPDHPSPAVSDKLAQRNLAIVNSENPGSPGSHRVPHTFEIVPTRANVAAGELPDELMIDWGKTPAGSLATIYMPEASASEMLRLAASMYRSVDFALIDEHTIRCKTGGMTYLPIPSGGKTNFAGLITIDLPETIRVGQVFTVVVRQVTSSTEGHVGPLLISRPESEAPGRTPLKWRRILGSFQITIPVRHKEALLRKEERLLGNLRWIQKSIPRGHRWAPVFDRYVKQIARRVDAFGGNSSTVVASPSDTWIAARDKRCRWLASVTATLLGLLVIALGTLVGAALITTGVLLLILLIVIGVIWMRRCRPPACGVLRMIIAGAGAGALVLAILLLLGMSGAQLSAVLAVSTIVTGIAAIIGRAGHCF